MNLHPAHCCVHTHSVFCDGKDTLETMAAAACAAGVRYFGASSHSPTPVVADVDFVMPADSVDYRTAVLALRERYEGRMEVLLGLEWDSLSPVDPYGYDYWIGSVHYQLYDDGRYYPSDRAMAEHLCEDPLSVVERYYTQVARVAAMKPTILGHLDLITRLNEDNCLFDEGCARYCNAALEALHTADPKETLLEINTGGMCRGYRRRPYPDQFLLREWRAMGGEIILTSDAHRAEDLIWGYDAAAEVARAAGYTRSVILTRCGRVECEL